MEAAGFLENLVDGFRDVGFVGDVCFDGVEFAWILLGDGFEFIAGFSDVDGIDCLSVV